VRGDRAGVEPGEWANRDRLVVDQLRVPLDLLERDQLADLDVAPARLLLRQRRTPRLLVLGYDPASSVGDAYRPYGSLVDFRPLRTYGTY
jgi:hypothetical protein